VTRAFHREAGSTPVRPVFNERGRALPRHYAPLQSLEDGERGEDWSTAPWLAPAALKRCC